MRRAKILIVEDEAIVAESIKNNLEKHGYRVASLAASGEKALQIAEKENPDLVLMDIVLKGELDGIKAADQIRKQLGIPVIFLTAYSNNEIFQSAKTTEPFGYITKPFDDKQLVLSIEIALYKSEIEKEKEKLVKALQKEITERKNAEEALKNAEQQIEYILGATKTGLDIIDSDFTIVYIDPEWQKIYGDYRGRKCYEYFAERNSMCPTCGIPEALKIQKPVVTEEVLPKEGNRPIMVTTIPFQDENGEWLVAEVNVDITERKKAEEAVKRSEEYFRAVIENALDIIIIVDKKGIIKYVSPSVERFLGYKQEEIIGKNGFGFIQPIDLPRAITDFGKAILMKGNIIPNSFRMRHKDGSERIFEGLGSNLLDNPAVAGFVMNVHDVTERKRAEEALKESEEKFRLAFENANTGMYLVDLDGNIQRVNTRMCEIFGYSKEELEHMNVITISYPEDVYISLEFINGALSKKYDYAKYEKRYVSKQGQNIWGQVSISLVRDSHGNPLYFVSQMEDITNSKRMAQEIKELSKFPSENSSPVLRVKNDGTVLYANQAGLPVLKAFGCRTGEVLPGKWKAFFEKIMHTGIRKEYEIEYENRIINLLFTPIEGTNYINIY